MTTTANTIHILDLLALNIREGSETARALVGAQSYRLHLGKDLTWAAMRLSQIGTNLAQDTFVPSEPVPAQFIIRGVRKLPMPDGSPTDIMDLGLDLDGPNGEPIALLRLDGVSAGWATQDRLKGLERIAALLKAQFKALSGGPVIFAAPMLRLVTLIRELDENAVSHSVKGLLSVLAGNAPNRVETMAMRISGLAESGSGRLEERDVVLSDVALDMLDQAGISRAVVPLSFVSCVEDASTGSDAAVSLSLVPFARARILEQQFDVAEFENTNRLWFRPAGSGTDWTALANSTSDGWAAIAAEIIGHTLDITLEFAQMHMIRRRDLPTDEIAEAYELDGMVWWLREGEAGTEARLDAGVWQRCDLAPDISGKRRALAALFLIDGEVVTRLEDEVRDWSRRMAQSVQVAPYMDIAAE